VGYAEISEYKYIDKRRAVVSFMPLVVKERGLKFKQGNNFAQACARHKDAAITSWKSIARSRGCENAPVN